MPHRDVIARPRAHTEAPKTIRGAGSFDRWCRSNLYTRNVVKATALIGKYCDLQLQSLYLEHRLERLLADWSSGGDVAQRLGFVESADVTMHAMLYRLARRTRVVEIDGVGMGARFRHAAAPADPSDRVVKIRAQLEELGGDFVSAADFIDFGVQHFTHALKDDPELMDRILSGRDQAHAQLWHDATNRDPLQDLHGRLGAEVLARRWTRGRILEVGGGTGNGIRHLIERLQADDALDRIEHYIFTDISNRFIMGTRKEISRAFPELSAEWKFLDINEPLRASRISTEGIGLIYGVNAAHVAKDIVAFLRECHDLLVPGGQVVFAERMRMEPFEMAPRELTLNLSIYHRSAAVRSALRPMHTYLSPDGWVTALREAGFEAEILPDLEVMSEHFPDQYAAVVIGQK